MNSDALAASKSSTGVDIKGTDHLRRNHCSLLLIGLATRLATVPLLIDIAVAIYSTKIVTFAKNGFCISNLSTASVTSSCSKPQPNCGWSRKHETVTGITSSICLPEETRGSPRPHYTTSDAAIPNVRDRSYRRTRPQVGAYGQDFLRVR